VQFAALPDMVDSEGQEGSAFNTAKAASVAQILVEFETTQVTSRLFRLVLWLSSLVIFPLLPMMGNHLTPN
jgi:hypothetical protein